MIRILLLLSKMQMISMRSYSHWKKEIPLYLTSYIKLLESKMLKKLKQKIINETHIWNISFFGVAQRDPYMEHQHDDVIDSKMKLNSNNLEKEMSAIPQRTHSVLHNFGLSTKGVCYR